MVDHGSRMNASEACSANTDETRTVFGMPCRWSAALTLANRGQRLLCAFPPAGVRNESQPPEQGRYLAEL